MLKLFARKRPPVGAAPGHLEVSKDAPKPKITAITYDQDSLDEREISDVEELASRSGFPMLVKQVPG